MRKHLHAHCPARPPGPAAALQHSPGLELEAGPKEDAPGADTSGALELDGSREQGQGAPEPVVPPASYAYQVLAAAQKPQA